jgi:hypothetical protein
VHTDEPARAAKKLAERGSNLVSLIDRFALGAPDGDRSPRSIVADRHVDWSVIWYGYLDALFTRNAGDPRHCWELALGDEHAVLVND